jgi:FkbM family methyltransferase
MLLVQRLLFRNHPVVCYCWKKRYYLVCDNRYSQHYSPQSVLAEHEYEAWLKTCIRNGECSYINVGAHIGGFDVAVMDAALDKVPFAVSVELNPRTFAALQYNIALNNFRTVHSLNAGVSGEPGGIAFTESSCSLSDSIFAQPGTPSNAAIEVPLLTLEDIMGRYELRGREIDLLKLDCEGAEYSIVRTAPSEVLRQFRHIIVEIHDPPDGEALSALVEKLQLAGFMLFSKKQLALLLMFWQRKDA